MPVANDTYRRKLAFTTAFDSHGNVRRAMREAGVSSPTTAYRWLADYRALGPDWVNRPPRKTRSVPGDVADLVIRIAETEPGWGKARIARQANTLLAGNAISPNGVQSVLRDAGLWPLEPGSVVAIAGRERQEEQFATVDAGAVSRRAGRDREFARRIVRRQRDLVLTVAVADTGADVHGSLLDWRLIRNAPRAWDAEMPPRSSQDP